MLRLFVRAVQESLAARLASPPDVDEIVLNWLGQAGFLLEAAGRRILIDPYLSDTLAEKYRGTATPHERLTPPTIAVEALGQVDLVVVTHHHTDHMDPGTLGPLARRCPDLRFVVPRAARDKALRCTGAAPERLILVDSGDAVYPFAGLRIVAIRAAHETIEVDAAGHHRFLGYGLTFSLPLSRAITIVHTGDTVPFPGQVEEVAALRPDLLLAPVNGRSAELTARGIPGNMSLDEAIELTARVRTPAMMAHHYGMFAFNTASLSTIEAKAVELTLPIRLIPARVDTELRFGSTQRSAALGQS